ncbi:MAG: efflux RND transporter periplasmic adaptor subunit [Hyphomicrobiales bacterium]
MEASSQRAIQNEIESTLELDPAGARRSARRTFLKRLMLTVVGVAVIGGGYLWWGSGDKETVRYTTEAANRGSLVVIVTATGSVEPTNQVEISSELSGTVRSVLVDYNDEVSAGQPLAELDTDKLKATAESSRAKLLAARAKEAEAKATTEEKKGEYQRKRDLAARKVVSTQELDTAKAAYDRALAGEQSAAADIAVAEADLQLAETNLSKARIVSPISGVVLSRAVDLARRLPPAAGAGAVRGPDQDGNPGQCRRGRCRQGARGADGGVLGRCLSGPGIPGQDQAGAVRVGDAAGGRHLQGDPSCGGHPVRRSGRHDGDGDIVEKVENALLVPNAALRYSPPVAEADDNTSLLQKLLPFRMPFRKPAATEETGKDARLYSQGRRAGAGRCDGRLFDGRRTSITGGDLADGQAVITDSSTVSK